MNSTKLTAAKTLIEQRRFKAAIRKLNKRANLAEELLYADAFEAQGKSRIALTHLNSLVRQYPKESKVILQKQPAILQALGETKAANDLSCQLLLNNPIDTHGYLSHLQRGFDAIPQLNENLEKVLKSSHQPAYTKGAAAYCLFNVTKDDSKYDFLHKGAQLIRSTIQYHHAANIRNIRSIRDYFPVTLDTQEKRPLKNAPIFIVGMPRSGTTLLEQMLGAHSKTLAVGESVNISRLFAKHALDKNGQIELSKTDFAQAGSEYLKLTCGEDSNKRRIIDKMPSNFIYVGFILSMFPNAKIIYSDRNSMDNCFSIYKAVFEKNRIMYSYNQSELADYQISCRYLMDYWARKYPSNLKTIGYEKLVSNTEEELRGLLDFCALEWEEACLDFHKSKNVVHTLSAHQVKKPVHSTSIGNGMRLIPHLPELAAKLGIQA